MRTGSHYSHPRFRDVTFVVLKSHFYSSRWKIKVDWYVRGERVNVETKHEIIRQKALEFKRTGER